MTRLIRALCELAEQERLERFVVGLPRLLNGKEGTSAKRARRFAEVLEQASGVPVELFDEWLTTREAAGRLRESGLNEQKARQRVDGAAAAIILQAWLDARTRTEP